MMQKSLIIPAALLVLIVALLPTMAVVNYSFQTPYGEPNEFVGFDNYRKILHDSRWWDAFKRNLIFSIIVILIEIPLGLGLALLLYKKGKINGVISTVIVLPVLLPWVTVGLMWRLMCRSVGPITTFFNFFNFDYNIFLSSTHAFWTIVLMDVWHWTSIVFIVLLAGLAGMRRAPILAAKTEGASRWRIFRCIQLPALKFPLIFLILIRFMDSFKIYDEVNILTAGGPGLSTEFLTMYVKRLALDQWILGPGAAASLIYLFTVLVVCISLMLVLTKGEGLI